MKGNSKKSHQKPKSVKIDQIEFTPADTAPISRAGQASEGVTTGGSSSSSSSDENDEEETTSSLRKGNSKKPKNSSSASPSGGDVEMVDAGKVVGLRVVGPSDRQANLDAMLGNGSRKRSRSSSSESGRDEGDKPKLLTAHWTGMKDCMRWRVEWGKDSGLGFEEFYMTPLSNVLDPSKSIENIEYFHRKNAMTLHMEANPCLTYEWKQLWPLLSEAGWTQEMIKKGGKKKAEYVFDRFRYIPSGADSTSSSSKREGGGRRAGLHRFRSKTALCFLVNRFPYLLQDDETFAETLQGHGWNIKRTRDVPRYSHPRHCSDNRGFTLDEIRDMIWTKPSLLFASSSIPETDLMKAIAVPEDVARAPDAEPDTPSPSKVSSGSRTTHPANLEDFLSTTDSLSSDNVTHRFVSMLDQNGWKAHDSSDLFEDDWYRFEKLTVAPWYDASKGRDPVLGMDAFWATEDIFKFMKKYGTSRPSKGKPILLEVDYCSWNRDRGIQHTASKYCWNDRQNLLDLLLDAGWVSVPAPSGLTSVVGSIDGSIFIPSWHAKIAHKEALWESDEYSINNDYFLDAHELARYLEKNGNSEVKATSRSRRAVTKEEPSATHGKTGAASRSTSRGSSSGSIGDDGKKMPVSATTKSKSKKAKGRTSDSADSPEGEASQLGDTSSPETSPENRIANIIEIKGKHAFAEVWDILKKELHWKCLNDTKGVAVHVAPWSGGTLGNHRFQPTPDDQINRSYFFEKESLLKYLTKYGPNKVETDPTPPEQLGRGVKRRLKDKSDGDMPSKKGRKASKAKKNTAQGKGKANSKKSTSHSSTADDLNEDELAAMYSSDEDKDEEGVVDEEENEEDEDDDMDVVTAQPSAPVPRATQAEEAKFLRAGVPDFIDSFRSDATALYKHATGRRDLEKNEKWLDVMDYRDVSNLLSDRRTWSWGYFRNGQVERSDFIHRIPDLMKRTNFKDDMLEDYTHGLDYFFGEEEALTFIHGQLRAFGCNVLKMSWDARQQRQGFAVQDPVTVDESSLWHYVAFHIADSADSGYDALLESVPRTADGLSPKT